MLTEQGVVSGVDSDGIWVETLKASACGQCSARAGCGQRLFAGAFATSLENSSSGSTKSHSNQINSSMTTVKAFFPKELYSGEEASSVLRDGWTIGDIALIALEERALVQASLISYGTPLIGLVAFSFVGGLLALPDAVVAMLALAGLIVGGLFVRKYASVNVGETKYHPVVVNKIIAPTLS